MRTNRTSRQPEILLEIGRSGAGPMHRQVEHALREAVRSGRLPSGSAVPSTRTLARDLRMSRGVVTEAYEQLIAEGYLVSRPGARTAVARVTRARPTQAKQQPAMRFRFDFRPGVPDLTHFPVYAWSRCSRRVLRRLQVAQLGYGDPRGTEELRTALADYLARVRGVSASADNTVIGTGFAQCLDVVARALLKNSILQVAVEDPCHPEMRRIFRDAGMTVCSVPVDDQGLRVDLLAKTRAQAVLVTPAHQFPTGCVLAPSRRRELLAWATRANAYIIEDDYDAEYRYDRNPVGALHGLAPERVIYAGSASKILAPGLRLGWVVGPQPLLATLEEIKRAADLGSPALDQLVYADFLLSGELDRHLRRMRAIYQHRRDTLLASLARHCHQWEPQGAAAGLHLVARLPRGSSEYQIAKLAAANSVRIYPMSHYTCEAKIPAAVVFGYGALTDFEIAAGIARLGRRPR